VIRVLAARQDTVMATRARANGLGVVESHAAPGCRPMTVFTDVGRRQVIRRLACRGHTVMAGKAVGRNATVVESHDRRKRDSEMASFALVARRRVVDRLAGRKLIVVAADALSVDLIVIHSAERQETPCRMAGGTSLRCDNMACGFRRRHYDTARAMTVFTLAPRIRKIAPTMAVAAPCAEVPAIKTKARRIVIEIGSNNGLRERDSRPQHGNAGQCGRKPHASAHRRPRVHGARPESVSTSLNDDSE